MSQTALVVAPPFDLSLSLRAMAGFSPCSGEQQLGDGWVRKAFSLADGTATVAEVSCGADGVALAVHGPGERAELEAAVSRWLSLSDDTTGFLAAARADPAMQPVLAETEGLHQVRFASLAEGASYFVLAQRTSQAVAGGRKRRLAAAFGPAPIALDGVDHQAFPTLDRLAGLSVGELAPFTANARQAEYLAAVLQRLAGWPPEWGYQVPTAELLAELRSVRGVGDFTAGGIALRVLGRLDVAPAFLPTFTRAIAALYGAGSSMDSIAERYGEHLGLWGYHVRTALSWLGAENVSPRSAPAPVRPARAGSSARTPRTRRRAG